MKKKRQAITVPDLELYAQCPKLFRFEKQKGPTDSKPSNLFAHCVRETIIHMYLIELVSKHKAEFHSIKLFWDKVFWREHGEANVNTLQLSERGLDIVYNYFENIYSLKRYHIAAVKIPYEYKVKEDKVSVEVEMDVIVTDPEVGDVFMLSFVDGQKDSENMLKTVMSSINEMIKMSSMLKESPASHSIKATFYNISRSDLDGCTVDVGKEMTDKIDKMINYLALGISNDITYLSRTEACNLCDHADKCQF